MSFGQPRLQAGLTSWEFETGCMITINHSSDVIPLYLKDVEDEKGKVKPRLVDITSPGIQMIFRNNLHYLTKEDYRAAKKYVKHPEEYDFYNILEWDQE